MQRSATTGCRRIVLKHTAKQPFGASGSRCHIFTTKKDGITAILYLVPRIGLEPTRLSTLAPETSASTISPSGLVKTPLQGLVEGFLRSEADSNRCTRFCRPLPSHSAIRPIFVPFYPFGCANIMRFYLKTKKNRIFTLKM